MPRVAVITPAYREHLSPDEWVSYMHCARYLQHYERFAIAPASLRVPVVNCRIRRFADHYFESTATYSRLLLSREFYEAFLDYDYILIYQLDCLVFADALADWCTAGHDYIGAPWLRARADPGRGFSRVGNGGLSLRSVSGALHVIDAARVPSWRDCFDGPMPDLDLLPRAKRLVKRLRVLRETRLGARLYMSQYALNEDRFWSDRARLFCPEFKIAPVEVGLRFAVETAPRYCFEVNGRQLPFGCHAWAKHDRDFWQPYLLG